MNNFIFIARSSLYLSDYPLDNLAKNFMEMFLCHKGGYCRETFIAIVLLDRTSGQYTVD